MGLKEARALLPIRPLHPVAQTERKSIEASIDSKLPETLSVFLEEYGYGSVNDFFIITPPDVNFFIENYGEYLYFWDFESEDIKTIIKTSITIGHTIDGDTITFQKKGDLFYFLPRHSEHILCFPDFNAVIRYIIDRTAGVNPAYFDPSHQREIIFIKQRRVGTGLDIVQIHTLFLERFSHDNIINGSTQQPVYVIHAIGGWIRFSLDHRSAIAVKYQQPFYQQAKVYIDFFNELIKQHS